MRTTLGTAIATGIAATLITVIAPTADARGVYDNCTALNKKWPHGVGRSNAKDHTSGTPVTTFKRSTKLYNEAMRANSRLDGDKDGIACEKA